MPQMAPMSWVFILLYTLSLAVFMAVWMNYLLVVSPVSSEGVAGEGLSKTWKW